MSLTYHSSGRTYFQGGLPAARIHITWAVHIAPALTSHKEIRETPPLPPAALLKLGAYYQGYETNVPLGNHLELVAMFNLASNPEIQECILKALVGTAAAGRSTVTVEDSFDWEDFFDCGSDESTEKGGSCFLVRFIPFSNTNLGLLVETPQSKQHKRADYVIGVSPEPAN